MSLGVFTHLFCFISIIFCVYKVLKIISRSVYHQKKRYSTRKSSTLFYSKHASSWETRCDMGHYESYLSDLDSRLTRKLYSVLFIKSRMSLRREAVHNALVLLSKRHPLLRAKVDVPSRGYSFYENIQNATEKQFVILQEEDFTPQLRFINTSHWRIVLEEELMLNKGNKTQLWSTILLREQYHASDKLYMNTLLFLFDQVIMDRRSIIQFIEDFVSFLCKLLNCDIHVADTRPETSHASVEELMKEPTIWKSLLLMSKEKLGSFFSVASSQFQQISLCRNARGKPCFQSKNFSTADTSQLLSMCEKMNCSLTSLFTTAWLVVQASNSVNGTCEKGFSKQDVTVIMDCRSSFTTQLQSYLGNYSSNVTLRLTIGHQRNFWKCVEHCEKSLNIAVKNEHHLDFIWKMKYHNPHRNENYLSSRSSFEVADVGKFNLMKSDPFMVEDIYIGGSDVAKECLTLAIINHKLCCGMYCRLCENEIDCTQSLNALFAVIQNMCCQSNVMAAC